MYDDDRDALAAEYVLGTLSTDERDQAEALLVIDPGFAEIVRVWERRLGELNVMVEAVEPPPEVWDKIRSEIDRAGRRGESPIQAIEETPPHPAPTTAPDVTSELELALVPEPPQDFDAPTTPQDLDLLTPPRNLDAPTPPQDLDTQGSLGDSDESSAVAALASSLLGPTAEVQPENLLTPDPGPGAAPTTGRSADADIVYLAHRVRRWRRITLAVGAIAALLAIFVAIEQFAPGLVPLPLNRQPPPVVTARSQAPSDRLVAVLQQEPTAPAFLVTVDQQSRTLTVRRVSATPETDRSYELWLISSKFPNPRSLGIVGAEEFTTRSLPPGFDRDTIRAASYAISLEPGGGSPSGVPTGPILFTGKMVESLPGSPPPG
jgi:anti-sigma-K factor RskA